MVESKDRTPNHCLPTAIFQFRSFAASLHMYFIAKLSSFPTGYMCRETRKLGN